VLRLRRSPRLGCSGRWDRQWGDGRAGDPPRLLEETGLDDFDLGPLVWTRTHLVPLGGGRWDGQSERYYLVRTRAFEPVPQLTWEELREENMSAVRWWALDELETAETKFAPRRLPALVRSLLEEGPPAAPIDAGV
jgi:hypothetical protein